jgi:hypothetical protein
MYLLLAEVEQHSHPISLTQLGLVVVQALIALVSVVLTVNHNRKIRTHNKDMALRGAEALETQKADVLVKVQDHINRIGAPIRRACDDAVKYSLDGTGTKPELALATANLGQVLGNLGEIPHDLRGLTNEKELNGAIITLKSAIQLYLDAPKETDPKAERVRSCAAIEASAKELRQAWDKEAQSRIDRLQANRSLK